MQILYLFNNCTIGFLRQNKDGTTSMKIILDSGDDGPERPISLGAFIGKLSQGSGHLQGMPNIFINVDKQTNFLLILHVRFSRR